MDFMKVFDQTVREIKREVNLKVLKVPEIEQKVLDATDDAPWGPHGSTMGEIAQATKKFTECQMIMNVLWTRLGETGQGLASCLQGIDCHRIFEHTFQISSLTSFEYVEPNGKDSGLNVRKKAETIASLLNNKDKIHEVRSKAAANRDKYIGLSSSGISYKSSTASFGGNNSSFQSRDRYGGGISGTRDEDSYDSYKQEKSKKDSYTKSHRRGISDDQDSTFKKGSAGFGSKDQGNMSSRASKSSANLNASDKKNSVSSNYDDDDFDPRGTSSTKSASQTPNQVDLFGESLIGDLMDAATPVPTEALVMNANSEEVDLFADAAFVSAPPQAGKEGSSETQKLLSPHFQGIVAGVSWITFSSQFVLSISWRILRVDLFTSQPAYTSAVPSTFDFFSSDEPVAQPGIEAPKSDPPNTNVNDPFAAVAMNNFDGRLASSNPPQKEGFQVKSGIWADSLSRGLIDLNISAPKKVSLVDVGVVGDLTDGLDEREKGPPTSFYMGRAMGMGSGLGKSGFTSSQSQATGGDDFFSTLGGQQYQFGNFK
ncbi:EPSIN/ENT-RELATED [Salix koriyanagi]|uniref:EPSIN/ENT-RELATED n=1 Tax=Salix koriyanagi TaxID=2511006 RepID=A0A9Q0VBG3_9ROSI|nr:EPSIN/ENT-RELATED [Salix koriyanagi]